MSILMEGREEEEDRVAKEEEEAEEEEEEEEDNDCRARVGPSVMIFRAGARISKFRCAEDDDGDDEDDDDDDAGDGAAAVASTKIFPSRTPSLFIFLSFLSAFFFSALPLASPFFFLSLLLRL